VTSAIQIDVRKLADVLGGSVAGRNAVIAPGPGHSRADRSLSIRLDPSAPGGFVVHSFSGDDPIACRDYVRERLGLERWKPDRQRISPQEVFRPKPAPRPPSSGADFRAVALRIWSDSSDPRATLAEKYLADRGLTLPDEVAGSVVRFHPRCSLDGEFVPAMVTLFRCISTNEPVAIQRTFLDKSGKKLGRKMLGSVRDAAIKVDPHESVERGLFIGEGFETCLAARHAGLRPAWAVGSAGAIASFPTLPGIDSITILGERDDNGANDRAAQQCSSRWIAAGRDAFIVMPTQGADLADAWAARQ
jgi:Toprim domain-containing protein